MKLSKEEPVSSMSLSAVVSLKRNSKARGFTMRLNKGERRTDQNEVYEYWIECVTLKAAL
jgi:hypothetical protein